MTNDLDPVMSRSQAVVTPQWKFEGVTKPHRLKHFMAENVEHLYVGLRS